MPLISHRGGAGLAAANTLASIEAGAKYHPDYIELDINQTADGIIVLHHGSMARFMQGKRTKESYNELRLQQPNLLTLDVFCQKHLRQQSYIFDLKLKDHAYLDIVSDSLKKLDLGRMAFTSPHADALSYMQGLFPECPIFQNQPYHHGPLTALEIARLRNFDGVALNKWWMTPFVYWLCRLHGKELMCYTIDGRRTIQIVKALFPRVYIVTNRPDRY